MVQIEARLVDQQVQVEKDDFALKPEQSLANPQVARKMDTLAKRVDSIRSKYNPIPQIGIARFPDPRHRRAVERSLRGQLSKDKDVKVEVINLAATFISLVSPTVDLRNPSPETIASELSEYSRALAGSREKNAGRVINLITAILFMLQALFGTELEASAQDNSDDLPAGQPALVSEGHAVVEQGKIECDIASEPAYQAYLNQLGMSEQDILRRALENGVSNLSYDAEFGVVVGEKEGIPQYFLNHLYTDLTRPDNAGSGAGWGVEVLGAVSENGVRTMFVAPDGVEIRILEEDPVKRKDIERQIIEILRRYFGPGMEGQSIVIGINTNHLGLNEVELKAIAAASSLEDFTEFRSSVAHIAINDRGSDYAVSFLTNPGFKLPETKQNNGALFTFSLVVSAGDAMNRLSGDNDGVDGEEVADATEEINKLTGTDMSIPTFGVELTVTPPQQ